MLVSKAIEARKKSYCPYSNFAVGAALLTADGRVYTGANIESVSFSPTVCAERVAFFTAVHAGERDFSAIAVVGGKADQDVNDFCPPCGVCRQVMTEFCKRDFTVLLSDGKNIREFTLEAILPESFSSVD
ncbi:MAG: cytidine deaminase [Clostridia bacterium]|nr:cytidine deaminase [Clostridia bacterium]